MFRLCLLFHPKVDCPHLLSVIDMVLKLSASPSTYSRLTSALTSVWCTDLQKDNRSFEEPDISWLALSMHPLQPSVDVKPFFCSLFRNSLKTWSIRVKFNWALDKPFDIMPCFKLINPVSNLIRLQSTFYVLNPVSNLVRWQSTFNVLFYPREQPKQSLHVGKQCL